MWRKDLSSIVRLKKDTMQKDAAPMSITGGVPALSRSQWNPNPGKEQT